MDRIPWVSQLSRYEGAGVAQSLAQIVTSFVPYFLLLTAQFVILQRGYPYWMAAALVPLAGLFLVRIFIILHDCSHKSYLGRSVGACFVAGHICGILTFTSFFEFRRSHVLHHANVGNLEKRGIGDIWTMTVDEYRSARPWKRALYRMFRNPFFLFGIAPTLKFVVLQRFPTGTTRSKELMSIIFTDVMIGLIILAAHFTIGIKMYMALQLPVIALASSIGVWLFYIQHQFENVYWAHEREYDRFKAAMKGSAFYNLPGILRWFTGNIGYHHVHHMNYRIPNFNLKKCYDQTPELRAAETITPAGGFACMSRALWDEKTRKLITFSALKNRL